MSSFPTALTIAGSDSGGGAGIQADLKTFTVLGVYGASVLTALTAQNTVGVQGVHPVPPEFVAQQFDSVCSDLPIGAAKTGMLADAALIEVVAAKVKEHGVHPLVVDPVMVAKSGDRLLAQGAQEALIRCVLPLAEVITPNLGEAEVLSGMSVRDPGAMREAARRMRDFGCGAVLVKGGHLRGEALDILYDGSGFTEFRAPRIDSKNTHGTGCTLSAAIAANLAKGHALPEAVRQAKEFITEAIRDAPQGLGAGHGPLNHMCRLGKGG
ncbi:MAG: bifunctional hydroxymethylpyrimidine kinase/phosphomethylpyrimidine kinase [Candidatus Tectomicrobia bacterium]|nr:bifunctional hydroxymethylpyrimidine kinase/phosphomethylpyrimidine kinase [Candidatus Tectomicrobia bacterium]